MNSSSSLPMTRSGRIARTRLRKDLVRDLKRGHAWLFSHSVETLRCEPGSVVEIVDRKADRVIATGIGDPDHPIPVRVCRTKAPFGLDDRWLSAQLDRALLLRKRILDSSTTGYRLVAGEGDGIPGLIIDVYRGTAVMKLDGGAPQAFYQPDGIAQWLQQNARVERVVLRSRQRGEAGTTLFGEEIDQPVWFLENGLQFSADVYRGQKTGFFLDQRDNRHLIEGLAQHKSVLNLFSFNGGFSVAAGRGNASQVTSVDIAKPAIEASRVHWDANALNSDRHEGVAVDCFDFLADAISEKRQWDIVICDPPSFAPSAKARAAAIAAYGKLAQLSAQVTSKNGLLALASCSSHVDRTTFLELNSEALGRARRKANLLADRGLPMDHPTPLAMPELRYLKFLLFQMD